MELFISDNYIGALEAVSFEHLLAWIDYIMKAFDSKVTD